jgi:hypothetical protein
LWGAASLPNFVGLNFNEPPMKLAVVLYLMSMLALLLV